MSNDNWKKADETLGRLLKEGVVCPSCDHINAAGESYCKACGKTLVPRWLPLLFLLFGVVAALLGWLLDITILLVIGVVVSICGYLALYFAQLYRAWAKQKIEHSQSVYNTEPKSKESSNQGANRPGRD
ncbi:MAG: hypothetical protein JRJ87_13300 [Deltaproteobacteria bacterium]|nr:hypothetical protein [Deltaproteobacteria bacterium]